MFVVQVSEILQFITYRTALEFHNALLTSASVHNLPPRNSAQAQVTSPMYYARYDYYINICDGYINPRHQVAVVTNIFIWLHLIFVDPEYGTCYVTLLMPRILRLLLDFWKICTPLMYEFSFTCFVISVHDAKREEASISMGSIWYFHH